MYRMSAIDSTTTNIGVPLPSGILFGQYEQLDELNERLYNRNVTLASLPANMNARSVPTRNTIYPVHDKRIKYEKPQYLDDEFAPMQSNAPPSGFKIDTESQLRNQCFALQHGASQGVYIPDSASDLYNVRIPAISSPTPQPFPNLFSVPRMTTAPPPLSDHIGVNTFQNHTRTQLRNVM